MTGRQKKFAEYYAQTGNTVQAALMAGYSENYANKRAHELLDNVGVKDHIRETAQMANNELILTAEKRKEILSDIAKSKKEFAADRIRAIDTLNKMTGEYINRTELSGDLGVVIVDDVK